MAKKNNNKIISQVDTQKILEKEIDLIQACINRMSQHSFYLKGWLVTLIGILLALKPGDIILINVCLILISIAFWYLNASYLRYEKQYRELYEWVIKERLKGNTKFLYDLKLDRDERFKSKVDSRLKLMFKNTLRNFYGSLILILIIILLVMIYKQYPNEISYIFNLISNHFNTILNNISTK